MKWFIVLLLTLSIGKLSAQFSEKNTTIKAGFGYTHDFPGLNGYTVASEYIFPLIVNFQGAIGAKRAEIAGYPRTKTIQEYTRASTLDFNLYWLPFRSEKEMFRIGAGYSFSFYNIKRAYPVVVENNGSKVITFSSQQSIGRTRGINLIVEYEYAIPATIISIGLRGALYKAYTRTYFIGPLVGFQL